LKKKIRWQLLVSVLVSLSIFLCTFFVSVIVIFNLVLTNQNRDIRTAVIDSDGRVVYNNWMLDSVYSGYKLDVDTIPEVTQALAKSFSYDMHFSKTEKRMMCYFAVKISDNTVLQFSATRESVFRFLLVILLVFLSEVLLCIIIIRKTANIFSSRIVDPLENLKFNRKENSDTKKLVKTYPELKHFVDKLRNQEAERMRFSANVSHEFKTPLSLLKNNFYMLNHSIQNNDTSSVEKYSYAVDQEIQYLAKLITSILELSKLDETGRICNEVVEVDKLIRDVIVLFSENIAESGLKVVTDLNSDALIAADNVLFQDIIRNLLENAVKYGKTTVKICTSIIQVDDKQYVDINIENDGIAIPQEHQEYIFERFYKVDEVRNNRGSVGIGLSVVKRVVEAFQGTIRLVMSDGKRTQFEIQIPIEKQKVGNAIE
jgi:two-component system phosphate regulon sensor histidine kinase PhoR